jgi:hypothetical protein
MPRLHSPRWNSSISEEYVLHVASIGEEVSVVVEIDYDTVVDRNYGADRDGRRGERTPFLNDMAITNKDEVVAEVETQLDFALTEEQKTDLFNAIEKQFEEHGDWASEPEPPSGPDRSDEVD